MRYIFNRDIHGWDLGYQQWLWDSSRLWSQHIKNRNDNSIGYGEIYYFEPVNEIQDKYFNV